MTTETKEEKPKKKKLIRINARGMYRPDRGQLLFGMYEKKTDDKGEVVSRSATSWAYCRESISDYMRTKLQSVYKKEDNLPLQIIMCGYKADFNTDKDRLFSAKKLLNVIEEHIGWEKTRMTTVMIKSDIQKEEIPGWLLTMNHNWTDPLLMSSVMLLMRVSIKYGVFPEVKSLEELKNTLSDMVEKFIKGAILDKTASEEDVIKWYEKKYNRLGLSPGLRKEIENRMKNKSDMILCPDSLDSVTAPVFDSNIDMAHLYLFVKFFDKIIGSMDKLKEVPIEAKFEFGTDQGSFGYRTGVVGCVFGRVHSKEYKKTLENNGITTK